MPDDLSKAVEGALFPLGTVVATPGVLDAFGPLATAMISELLDLHLRCDRGDIPDEDVQANVDALRDGDRIFSAFTCMGTACYVITEADRSSTTVLLPTEY